MVRAGLLVLALVLIGMSSPAHADESRGYAPYDGWFRGGSSYHGFSWRDPRIGGTDARRPDYTLWSGFDKCDLRLKYPLYRDPVHPVWQVATPACTGYVWPNRTDIQLCAKGVPAIRECCPAHHCTHRHHSKCHRKSSSCCASACPTCAALTYGPPRAKEPDQCCRTEPHGIPQGD